MDDIIQTKLPYSSTLSIHNPTLEYNRILQCHIFGVVKLRTAIVGHCAGCNAVLSLGIDHCQNHDSDKYGKGLQKRLRR